MMPSHGGFRLLVVAPLEASGPDRPSGDATASRGGAK